MIYSSPVNNVHTGIIVDYHRVRTGPNYFMVYYKGLSTCEFTRKDVRNRLGTARFTETSKVLSEWVDEMIEKYESVSDDSKDLMEYSKKEGFGPEAHQDEPSESNEGLDETDPNYQTKMIT